MQLWSAIFRRWRKPEPKAAVETLNDAARAELMAQARFLYGQGVSVRSLTEGENAEAPPEIGDIPLRP